MRLSVAWREPCLTEAPASRLAARGLHGLVAACWLLALPGVSRGSEVHAPSARQARLPPAEQGPADFRECVNGLVNALRIGSRRTAARREIIEVGRAATPVLVSRMKDPDFTIRWEMANVQGDIRDERAIPHLVDNVLHDVDPHVRWRSLWALTTYADTTHALALLGEAAMAPDETTRWNAAVGLSMFRDASCVPTLNAGLSQADPWRRWEAINALGRVSDSTSAQALSPILAGGSVRERGEAAMVLGKVGGPESVELLIRALLDTSAEVRWRACASLARLRDRQAVSALEALREREKDADVLKHVGRALARLQAD